ncbi:MAG: tryptophan-rich sensory protein [candidate division WOR-3 bacterium]|nr:tryptophan-rich sensory protein [candidate division WOR-3 bacterium]
MKDILKLLCSIIICQLAGVLGSLFTRPNIPNWYLTLKKPSIAPPNWVFAPVWTTLFLLMAIALYLVWRQGWGNEVVRKAMIIFFVQLVINVLWSAAFFGLRQPLAGFLVIIVLWFFIILTIVYFYNLSKTAGLLLVPYLLWVSFATVLNFMIFKLN